MKITSSRILLNIAILSIAAAVSTQTGQCQTYDFSGTIPDFTLELLDTGNGSSANEYLPVDGATYSETVTINAAAATISESGSISVPSTASDVFDTTREVTLPPVFPNPPAMETVTGALTLGLSINNDSLTFNTGVQPITWNGHEYTVNGGIPLTASFGLSYSLVTGGDTYAGTVPLSTPIGLNLEYGSPIDLSQYPSNIGLNAPTLSIALPPTGIDIADFTASNGFQEDLSIAPEPSTNALLGMTMATVCFYSWRRRLC